MSQTRSTMEQHGPGADSGAVIMSTQGGGSSLNADGVAGGSPLHGSGLGPPPQPQDSDEAPASLGNLTNMQPDFAERTGSVNRTDDASDEFRFTLTGTRKFRFELRGLSGNANLGLYDASGKLIARSVRGGLTVDSIARALGRGTYTIRVDAFSSGPIDYRLFYSNESVAGTPQTAIGLGNLTNMQERFREQAGTVNRFSSRDDYYRFTLGTSRTMRFDLRDLSGNANLRLLDASRSLVAQSVRIGTAVDSIERELERGTYYIQVQAAGAGTIGYRLRYGREHTLPASVDLGNLTFQSAWTARTGRLNRASNRDDYYRFTLTGTRAMWLWLGVNNDANLSLLNSLGWTLYSSERDGHASDSILQTLGRGTYYVRVDAVADGNIDYRLSAVSDAFVNLGELSRLTTDRAQTGTVSQTADETDVYRFNLASERTVRFELRNLTADANLRLYDASGHLVTDSTHRGTDVDTIFRTLEAGTWFISVDANASSLIDYELRYGLGVPGTTVSTAIDQGDVTDVSPVRTLTGEVNRSERPNSFYRFTLSDTRTIRIELRNLTDNADLYLLDRIGNQVRFDSESERGGISDESVVWTLGAGTYHIRVNAVGSGATINYELRYSNDSVVPGRRTESAFDLGNLTAARNVRSRTGQVNYDGNSDTLFQRNYYRFTLTDSRTMRFELTNLTQNADLYLLDRIGNQVRFDSDSENGGISDESITWTLGAGTYHILVRADDSSRGTTIDYNLRYSNDSVVPGRRTESAFNLGNLTRASIVRTRTGQVNYNGNSDTLFQRNYYRFTLTDSRTMRFELTNLTQNADLYLLDRIGNQVRFDSDSENSGISDESITWTLGAGTYHILVRADDSSRGTTIDYRLNYSSQLTSTRAPKSGTTPNVNSQPLWQDNAVSAAPGLGSDESKRFHSNNGVIAA